MKKQKRALGKGLQELIQDKRQAEELLRPKSNEEDQLVNLKIDEIRSNPYQPRVQFNEEALAELAQSIKEIGILQPLIVKAKGDEYELIAGERRLRAAKMAGMATVPAILRTMGEQEQAQVALIENVQRQDLNPIEEARAYRRVIETYGITQEELGEFIGKSRGYIGNTMRLLKLDERVIDFIEKGELSISHGKQLLGLPKEKQFKAAEKIVKGGLTVRKSHHVIPSISKKSQESIYLSSVETELMEVLGAKVRIIPGKLKGKIEIDYYGNDDLTRIVEFFKEQQL